MVISLSDPIYRLHKPITLMHKDRNLGSSKVIPCHMVEFLPVLAQGLLDFGRRFHVLVIKVSSCLDVSTSSLTGINVNSLKIFLCSLSAKVI